jgi:hypothetical protein
VGQVNEMILAEYTYPFVPKSSLKMRRGDYWPLRRVDGNYGFCVFLGRWAHMRSGLILGILDIFSNEPSVPDNGPEIPIFEAGHTHVKTFAATGASIVGNIETRLSVTEIELYLESLEKTSVVWGYMIPLEKVNEATTLVLQGAPG